MSVAACPKCGFQRPDGGEVCLKCGVIIAKWGSVGGIARAKDATVATGDRRQDGSARARVRASSPGTRGATSIFRIAVTAVVTTLLIFAAIVLAPPQPLQFGATSIPFMALAYVQRTRVGAHLLLAWLGVCMLVGCALLVLFHGAVPARALGQPFLGISLGAAVGSLLGRIARRVLSVGQSA